MGDGVQDGDGRGLGQGVALDGLDGFEALEYGGKSSGLKKMRFFGKPFQLFSKF